MCVLIQHITSSLSSFTFQNDFLAVLFLHSLSAHLSHCRLTVHKVFSPMFVLQTCNSAGFKTSSKKTLEDACLVRVKAECIRPSKQLKDTEPTPSDQAMPRVLSVSVRRVQMSQELHREALYGVKRRMQGGGGG